MNKEKSKTSIPMVSGLLIVLIGLAVVLNIAVKYFGPPSEQPPITPPVSQGPETPEPLVTPEPGEVIKVVSEFAGFQKFTSEEDFKGYVERNKEEPAYGFGGFGMGRVAMVEVEILAPTAPMAEEGAKQAAPAAEPERVSETNVQVTGIDEPDIVKTNGQEIYFSSAGNYYWRGFSEIMPRLSQGETKVIKATPPADLAKIAKIEKTGNLLLSGNVLVIFSGDEIIGYDISRPEDPTRKWEVELEDNNYVVASRLYHNKIYLITRQGIQYAKPCPIRPLKIDGEAIEIKCLDVYHPTVDSPIDVTYVALVLDAASGELQDKVSFVGKADSALTYMSQNGLYVTYSLPGDFVKFFYNFLTEEAEGLVTEQVKEKIRKLVGYDISDNSKLNELQIILETYYNSLSSDERLKVENEFNNRLQDYYKDHKRELEKTGIVKISVDKLEVKAIGEVPGSPLNQFSLDEYQDHLRVAVTIGQGWSRFGQLGESVSDVYVLDKDLKTKGSVKDLGEGERIYSVRFLEDKGYVVTFKQVDPFFVLDLSDPNKPELKGELKIPGYSSYLHPITKDKILGVGKEGSNVKLSLFDVSNPEKPREAAKYNLDEYWSDILDTHHAFLLDSKHEIFFLPGSRGGYVFSYSRDELQLKKAVSDVSARRALYINDYLYIIGDDEIVVLNELDWQEVNSLDLK